MAPTMPYDFSGYLADAMEQSSGLAHGYSAQLDSFRDRLDEADKYAETGYAPVLGGSALGAIGAALAGGSVGQIAGGAYGAGQLAYNNLELIEKSKRENLQKEIDFTETLAKDNINFSQQLVGAQSTYNMNRDLSYMKGEMPGTQPYNIEQTDTYNRQMALTNARGEARAGDPVDPAVREQIKTQFGVELGPEATVREADIILKSAGENRRQQGFSGMARRPPNSEETKFVADTKSAFDRITTLSSRVEQKLEPNIGVRITSQQFPQSQAGQIKQDLDFAAGVFQQAYERGIMTNQDYERYKNYFSVAALDTPETVARRLNEFKSVLDAKTLNYLTAQKAAGVRTEGFEQMLGLKIPDYFNEAVRGQGGGAVDMGQAPAPTGGANRESIMAMTPEQRAKRRAEINAQLQGRK